jgi:hypothetical protein
LLLPIGHAAALAFIAVATLRPTGPEPFLGWTTCLVCSNDGVAEAVQNVLLFVPLGLTLGLAGQRAAVVALAGLALSLSIECAQILIPGRDPNVGDIVWNATGAGAGWLAATVARGLAFAPRRVAGRRAAAAVAATVAVLVAIAWLFQPAATRPPYRAQRRSAGAGAILSASLGTVPLDPGRLPEGPTTDALALSAALRAVAIVGPLEESPYWLRVRDGRRRDVVTLRKIGPDLVYRYRTRAVMWSLDQPDLRARRAMASFAPGDTAEVIVARERLRVCAVVNQVPHCGLGPRLGRGWALLRFPRDAPHIVHGLLDVLWLALLYVPVGLAARRDRLHLGLTVVALAALWIVPALAGLEPTRLHEAAGALLGAGLTTVVTGAFAATPPPAARRP